MASQPHIPYRTCIGCGHRKSRQELIRFVLDKNHLALDIQQTRPGRGVYLCANGTCLRNAIKKKAFFRGLKRQFEFNPDKVETEFLACLKSKKSDR